MITIVLSVLVGWAAASVGASLVIGRGMRLADTIERSLVRSPLPVPVADVTVDATATAPTGDTYAPVAIAA